MAIILLKVGVLLSLTYKHISTHTATPEACVFLYTVRLFLFICITLYKVIHDLLILLQDMIY